MSRDFQVPILYSLNNHFSYIYCYQDILKQNFHNSIVVDKVKKNIEGMVGNASIWQSNHFTQVKQNVRFSLLKMAIKALSGRSNISLVCIKKTLFPLSIWPFSYFFSEASSLCCYKIVCRAKPIPASPHKKNTVLWKFRLSLQRKSKWH